MSGTILKDIGLYKSRIISTLLNSTDICEALLSKEQFTEEDIDSLHYTQVFPYLYIDEAQTEVLPYICVEVNVPSVPTRTVKDMSVIIFVYSHKKCMKYSKKGFIGTRVDIISDLVERQLRDMDNLGIGKLQLKSVTHLFPSNMYYGRQMIFNIPDFKVKR